jgi:thymidine kinase
MSMPMSDVGGIEVICGSMFSGKTEELIRRLVRARIARQGVQAFKPSIDDRYGRDHVVSHNGQKIPSVEIESAADILGLVREDTRVVGID